MEYIKNEPLGNAALRYSENQKMYLLMPNDNTAFKTGAEWQKEKDKAEYDKLKADNEVLLKALKESLSIIERMSDEFSEVANKHASFTNGEYKRIMAAIKQVESE